eukprot:GHUV01039261.1.p1 GENE.GHUV01039261.1~~GHUV01039261.1.p1  ORF type:complete len:260 (+),score=83.57 GHUV01039261.1:352-1131(+)
MHFGFHCMQAAYEHCVRAYIMRNECQPLGPNHPDTAAAAHNLGVVLDCLGKSNRGLQLVEEAQHVLTECLGPSHPRTVVAARNAQHIKHKIIKLSAEAQQLLDSSAAALNQQQKGVGGHSSPSRQAAVDQQQGQGTSGRGPGKERRKKRSGRPRGKGSGDDSIISTSESESSSEGDSRDSRNSQGPDASTAARGNRRGAGSMQDRLAAVSENRLHKAASANCGRNADGKQQYVDTREYTDPDYLGSGVFKASPEQKRLY